jgi:hypothetical protein
MDAVKIIGGALSAAGAAVEGALVWLPWHAVSVIIRVSKKLMPPNFFISPPMRVNSI